MFITHTRTAETDDFVAATSVVGWLPSFSVPHCVVSHLERQLTDRFSGPHISIIVIHSTSVMLIPSVHIPEYPE